MKGKIKVSVKNRHIGFLFTLERNITVLTGNSGTGKTKLINMVRSFAELGKSSGVTLNCHRPCIVLEGRNWESELEQTHESVVFVEESTPFLTSHAFAKAIQNSDNYYVLVTREPLQQIPYSIDCVKLISKNGKHPKLVGKYEGLSVRDIKDFPYDKIIVEDSGAGYCFLKTASEGFKLTCVTANGKSGILGLLKKAGSGKVLVVADAAALGSEIDALLYYRNFSAKNIDFFLPESFEWLILRSSVFKGNAEVQTILADPIEYIDCQEYFGWERFFTDLLVSASSGKPQLAYPANKSSLPAGYLTGANKDSILSAMSKRNK